MGCNNPAPSQKDNNKEDSTLRIKQNSKEVEKEKKILEAKIVLLGDVSVGKTSIASRYCKNSFNEHHINTIGGAYQQQKVVLNNGAMVKLHIWDTSGQERFRAMTNLYYRDAQVAILTYDITSESSFSSIDFWIEELKFKVENENMILCLVGNKSDVSQDERKVSTAKAKNFAQENNMIFYETSAKTGDCIKDLFVTIANKVYEQLKK
jgi:Ras-related protein Rab-5C